MTTKINNENAESGLSPYPVIIAATKGDPEAMKRTYATACGHAL